MNLVIPKVLKLEDISSMSNEMLMNAYRNGYQLEASINGLTATGCDNIPVNTTRTLTANFVSAGSGTITHHWSITKPNGTNINPGSTATVSYTFTDAGTYNVSYYATDSCPAGSQTSNISSCNIIVGQCTSTGVYVCDPSNPGYEKDNCGNSRANTACGTITKPDNTLLYVGVAALAMGFMWSSIW
jgi:hypothetical protein